MEDLLRRFWSEITARPDGPMAFRFYMQPAMAMLFAIRDGVRDARVGKSAYFWSLLTNSANRTELLKDGWKSVRKIFLLAAALDLVYQILVLRAFRPLETLTVAFALAIVPYVVVRGPINRFAKLFMKGRGSNSRRAA